jgi:hypothetical protein
MRRTLILAFAAVTALTIASVAVATLRTAGVSSTTATFQAAKNRTDIRTCTGDGDTYQITHGSYVGTIDFASPNDALDGPVALHINAVLNQTDNIGWVQGWFRVKDDVNDQDERHAQGRFWGTIDAGGRIDGFIQGRVNRRLALLVGGMSATFTPDGGFVDGKIGNAANHNPAALIGRPCKDTKPVKTPVAVRLAVKGEVAAIGADSITVNPRDGSPAQTCKIVSGKSPSVEGVATGSKVDMGCVLIDGQMTLLKLKLHRS